MERVLIDDSVRDKVYCLFLKIKVSDHIATHQSRAAGLAPKLRGSKPKSPGREPSRWAGAAPPGCHKGRAAA